MVWSWVLNLIQILDLYPVTQLQEILILLLSINTYNLDNSSTDTMEN